MKFVESQYEFEAAMCFFHNFVVEKKYKPEKNVRFSF